MRSLRARLLFVLVPLAAVALLFAMGLTYRQSLAETSALLDYQLRQTALSLRNQMGPATTIELPPEQSDGDLVIQVSDPFGSTVYASRPGLPILEQKVLGYSQVELQGGQWRVYCLQTLGSVIQVAQPVRVREALARAAAWRIGWPLMLLIPLMGFAIFWAVGGALAPLGRAAAEVQRRDQHSLAPIDTSHLPREIAPLVVELNRLLGRLDVAFGAQRAFVADAAHELRSPLTAVSLHLQLLDRAPDEQARHEARANLGAAVDRAVHLIEQLLMLARSEPRERSNDVISVSLETPAANAMADVHALAAARRIDMSLEKEADVRVQGQPEALRVLVRNLVDNAVRYTPEGGQVRVRVGEIAGAPVLQVTDSGPGIPAEDRPRVFDRFYRRRGAPEGGSGLGLAIVKAIAESHDARVTLDSGPAGGLSVTVTFPAAS
jgi:signal transduction histidine kinase